MSMYTYKGGGLFDIVGGLFKGAVEAVSSFIPGGSIVKKGVQVGVGWIGGRIFNAPGQLPPGSAEDTEPEQPAVVYMKMYLPANMQSSPPPAPQRATTVPEDQVQSYLAQGYTLVPDQTLTQPGSESVVSKAGMFGLGALPIVLIIGAILFFSGALKAKR